MKTKNANKSENMFIKEWNGTEFNLSILAKVTNSNKPFIYFYWPNKHNGGMLDRARKGGVGGFNDSRLKVKKCRLCCLYRPRITRLRKNLLAKLCVPPRNCIMLSNGLKHYRLRLIKTHIKQLVSVNLTSPCGCTSSL